MAGMSKHRAKDRSIPLPGTKDGETLRLSARLPALFGDDPLLQIDIDLRTEKDGDGERMSVHARVDGQLRLPPDRALPAPQQAASRSLAPVRAARAAGRQALKIPVVRRAAERLAGSVHSEVMVAASTSTLAQGVASLIPSKMKALGFGQVVAERYEQPLVETMGAADGSSQAGLVQIDKRHLPPQLAEQIGDKPFALTAAWVTEYGD